jgi:NAD(P)-dependent dehydrogenase (short-subunit alcohol dehydrogenase family)
MRRWIMTTNSDTAAIKNIFDVSGKVALITGATGSLGHALTCGLAMNGVKVFATGRDEKKLKAAAEDIKKTGGTVAHCTGSPVDHDDVKRVVDTAVKTFGGIDILITAAGMNKPAPIIEQSLEDWDMIMDANVKGTWLFCKEAGKVMIDQKRGGKVILVSSTRGELGMANYTAYSPSKGAVNLMTKSLACEWGKYNINVNAIAPTVFRSDLTEWMFKDDAFYQNFLKRIPIGRLGEPEDFIGTVIYLSSRASDFLTGAVIYVDGGYTAG